ncbi:MAG TPA: hypothetical protein VGM31_01410 [Puia sp.]
MPKLRHVPYGRTLLLLFLAGLLVYGYFYHVAYRFPPKVSSASIPVDAAGLISLADKNEALFNKKYLYKVLSVTGVVRDVLKNKNGTTVVLEGQHTLPEAVNCSLDTLYTPHPELAPGDSCTIRGNCAGRLKDVILLQCIIEKHQLSN